MERFINQIPYLLTTNSFSEIEAFLMTLDEEIKNRGYEASFREEQTKQLYQLMCRKFDGKRIGDIIIDKYLKGNERLTPTSIFYFYCKEKDRLGLALEYNRFSFYPGANDCYAFTDNEKSIRELGFYYQMHLKKYKTPHDFNYNVMQNLLHEIDHAYQYSIPKDTKEPKERLILHDLEFLAFARKYSNYDGLHWLFMAELQAEEFAKRTMLDKAKSGEYVFPSDIIRKKESEYLRFITPNEMGKNKRVGTRDTFRFVFNEVASYDVSTSYVKPKEHITGEIQDKLSSFYAEEDKLIDEYLKTTPDISDMQNMGFTAFDMYRKKELTEDTEIDLFLKAIETTDTKYGYPATNYQRYLETGALECFTSTNGARASMKGINHKVLKDKIIERILSTTRTYLLNSNNSTYTMNAMVNDIINFIGNNKAKLNQAQIMSQISEFIFSNDNRKEFLDLLRGNLLPIKEGVRYAKFHDETLAFINGLENNLKKRPEENDVRSGLEREKQLVEIIQQLQTENNELRQQLVSQQALDEKRLLN